MAWASSGRRQRLPSNWRALRRAVLIRDHNRCRWIEGRRRCTARATEVHHLVSSQDVGEVVDSNHLDDLIAICAEHHRIATQAQSVAKRRSNFVERVGPPIDFGDHPGIISPR